MNLQEQIIRTLREETDQVEDKKSNLKNKLKSIANEFGLSYAIKIVGGIKNYVKTVYDDDLINFFKESGIEPYKIVDRFYFGGISLPDMYINEYLVNSLNIDINNVGKFKWGSKKDNFPYIAFCELSVPELKTEYGLNYYRVAGRGSGRKFGYDTQEYAIPKTYRKQIFKQIVDKYNLDSYK
jgi:hypothetical protein